MIFITTSEKSPKKYHVPAGHITDRSEYRFIDPDGFCRAHLDMP